MATLEERLDRLESLEAIRTLKHCYCGYCDAGYDPNGLASLFWEDGVWDAGPDFGRHEGPEAIAAFFAGVSGSIVWARHLVMNEILEVDVARHEGRGEFQILQPCTFATDDGPQAAWLVGKYEELYVRREGVWKYRSLRAEIEFITPYEKGWHRATTLDG